MSPSVAIPLRPSPIFATASGVIAAAALVCTWMLLPGYARLALSGGIALGWLWQLRLALHWGPEAIRALELGSDRSLRCRTGQGVWQEFEILRETYVSRWLIVLLLGQAGRLRRALVLFPDSADANDLRRLRVRLEWGTGKV